MCGERVVRLRFDGSVNGFVLDWGEFALGVKIDFGV